MSIKPKNRDRLVALMPSELQFLVTLAGGLDARRRRLANGRDRGGISVETAIIIVALVALAGVIAIAIKELSTRFGERLDKVEAPE